jgi:glutamate racemase
MCMNAQRLASQPIGVFDSGVGGLSILKALQQQLPGESFVYLADSGNAPYGERDEAFVIQRSRACLALLMQQHHIKALVVACNTATALAIQVLRDENPELPIFGVEPSVKPGAADSLTHKVGVLATAATLNSAKFQELLHSLDSTNTEFVLQACDGLADAIEKQWQDGQSDEVRTLCEKYLLALGAFGQAPGEIDTLVLGCTHYPFASSELQMLAGESVRLLEPGTPVARRVYQVLQTQGLLANRGSKTSLLPLATGETRNLQQALWHWLELSQQVIKV